MAEQSAVCEDLWLLDGLEDFCQYSLKLGAQCHRQIAILSHELDEPVYGTSEFVQVISNFVRSSRHTQMQILVKSTRRAIESGHPLLKLTQRLSSKIQLRKITQQPNNQEMGFMLGDTRLLLYKNNDSYYRGFYNAAAAREVKPLREEFNYLWQYAETEPELQQFFL